MAETKAPATEPAEAPSTRNIFQRMLAAMHDVSYVQKTFKEGLKFSAVTHDDVTAKCRVALIKAGIYAYPEIKSTATAEFKAMVGYQGKREEKEYVAMTVELVMHFINVDNPSDRIAVPSIGVGVDNKLNQDKCSGKAISYAVKYSYLKGLALETGDDPDLEQDREETAKPAQNRKSRSEKKGTREQPSSDPADGSDGSRLSRADELRFMSQELAEELGISFNEIRSTVAGILRERFQVTDDVEGLSDESMRELPIAVRGALTKGQTRNSATRSRSGSVPDFSKPAPRSNAPQEPEPPVADPDGDDGEVPFN